MTDLRKLMLEELECRNYSQAALRAYLAAVEDFARYFHRRPDQLGPDHIRQHQAYLFRERARGQQRDAAARRIAVLLH